MHMKKILFYGDCQLSAIAKWIHEKHSDKFEFLDCKDCGLEPFWRKEGFGNFAVWSPENKSKQKEFYKCVHNKIEEADAFVFHPHEGGSVIPELNTEFLTQNLNIKQSICINCYRLFCYLLCRDSISPYFNHIKSKGISNKYDILDYLTNEPDPKFDEIFNSWIPYEEKLGANYHKSNLTQYINNPSKYPNSSIIDLHDFITANWRHKLLFVQHYHPSYFIYEQLIKQLFNILNEPLNKETLNGLEYPTNCANLVIPNFTSFSFVKKHLPNIELPPGGTFSDSTEYMIKYYKLN